MPMVGMRPGIWLHPRRKKACFLLAVGTGSHCWTGRLAAPRVVVFVPAPLGHRHAAVRSEPVPLSAQKSMGCR